MAQAPAPASHGLAIRLETYARAVGDQVVHAGQAGQTVGGALASAAIRATFCRLPFE
ncbi:hypothetical protein OIE67_16120 [Nonomuraea fuscirosea]|uniref:hypothetical protein n=1 Tax=Nonomuraea fuscirosea TaxID=1291556 RepID=UPI002DD9DB8C|nr:hypothetical protein [Nonomuraea fuscirosea]WSA56067.1 hypothetical protein OIE67_16120 [Nonomuraea fuscirosea]